MIGLYKGLKARASGAAEAPIVLEQIALAGDPRAWRELAWMHLEGELPDASEIKAIDLLEQAAAEGVAKAARELGQLHAQGRLSTGAHEERAVWWYRRGAELADPQSTFMAGVMTLNGRGTVSDPSGSVALFREAASAAHVEAEVYLGHAHANGDGVPKNPALAARHYLKATDLGRPLALLAAEGLRADIVAQAKGADPEAWYQLGELRHRANDDARALAAYEHAAGLGHGGAMYELAVRTREGRGAPQSLDRMAELLAAAAAWGCSNAQHDLGFMYTSGIEVEKDIQRAIGAYRRAAEQGNRFSISDLTVLLAERQAEGDAAERMGWLRKHADGAGAGAFHLGEAFRDGHGTVKDPFESARWFFRAALLGQAEAETVLLELAETLTRVQLHQADRIAGGDGRLPDTLKPH